MSFPLPCDRHRRHLQNLLTLPNGRPCPLNTPSCRSRPPAPARAPRPPLRATRSRGRVGSRRICLFVPISLSTLCSSFVHAIACDSISFLPDAERYCIARADHTCVCSSTDGRLLASTLGCCEQCYKEHGCENVCSGLGCHFFGDHAQSGSRGNFTLILLRGHLAVLFHLPTNGFKFLCVFHNTC